MERDDKAISCAHIQYCADLSLIDPQCPEMHVCYAAARNPHAEKRRKRAPEQSTPIAYCNAINGPPAPVIAGVCVSGVYDTEAIKQHPDAAGRITVQSSGVARVAAPSLASDIKIGEYVAVNTSAPVERHRGLGPNYATFPLRRVTAMTKRSLVLGRVCNIELQTHGEYILSVLLCLQLPREPHAFDLSLVSSEEELFQMYFPPALLYQLWECITPTQADATEAQPNTVAEKLREIQSGMRVSQSIIANLLEKAIGELEYTDVPSIAFPEFHKVSIMGAFAFLVGTPSFRGVLWYAETLAQAQTIVSQILLYNSDNSSRSDQVVSAVFKSDEEYELYEKFCMWSRNHYEHTYESKLESIQSCIAEAQHSYAGSA